MTEECNILQATEMLVHASAANMLGVYDINDFPSHCIPGRCICHILNLTVEVELKCCKAVEIQAA